MLNSSLSWNSIIGPMDRFGSKDRPPTRRSRQRTPSPETAAGVGESRRKRVASGVGSRTLGAARQAETQGIPTFDWGYRVNRAPGPKMLANTVPACAPTRFHGRKISALPPCRRAAEPRRMGDEAPAHEPLRPRHMEDRAETPWAEALPFPRDGCGRRSTGGQSGIGVQDTPAIRRRNACSNDQPGENSSVHLFCVSHRGRG